MKGYGGRFLSQNLDDGLWYEISHKGAKKKASQGKYELTIVSVTICQLVYQTC